MSELVWLLLAFAPLLLVAAVYVARLRQEQAARDTDVRHVAALEDDPRGVPGKLTVTSFCPHELVRVDLGGHEPIWTHVLLVLDALEQRMVVPSRTPGVVHAADDAAATQLHEARDRLDLRSQLARAEIDVLAAAQQQAHTIPERVGRALGRAARRAVRAAGDHEVAARRLGYAGTAGWAVVALVRAGVGEPALSAWLSAAVMVLLSLHRHVTLDRVVADVRRMVQAGWRVGPIHRMADRSARLLLTMLGAVVVVVGAFSLLIGGTFEWLAVGFAAELTLFDLAQRAAHLPGNPDGHHASVSERAWATHSS